MSYVHAPTCRWAPGREFVWRQLFHAAFGGSFLNHMCSCRVHAAWPDAPGDSARGSAPTARCSRTGRSRRRLRRQHRVHGQHAAPARINDPHHLAANLKLPRSAIAWTPRRSGVVRGRLRTRWPARRTRASTIIKAVRNSPGGGRHAPPRPSICETRATSERRRCDACRPSRREAARIHTSTRTTEP